MQESTLIMYLPCIAFSRSVIAKVTVCNSESGVGEVQGRCHILFVFVVFIGVILKQEVRVAWVYCISADVLREPTMLYSQFHLLVGIIAFLRVAVDHGRALAALVS